MIALKNWRQQHFFLQCSKWHKSQLKSLILFKWLKNNSLINKFSVFFSKLTLKSEILDLDWSNKALMNFIGATGGNCNKLWSCCYYSKTFWNIRIQFRSQMLHLPPVSPRLHLYCRSNQYSFIQHAFILHLVRYLFFK